MTRVFELFAGAGRLLPTVCAAVAILVMILSFLLAFTMVTVPVLAGCAVLALVTGVASIPRSGSPHVD